MHKFLKLFLLSTLIVLLSGCSLVYIDSESIDDIVNLLGKKTNLKNVSLEGYSYFLPQGVNLKESIKANSVLYYNGYKMYLYADYLSYYHKVENKYNVSQNSYYSKKFTKNNIDGYLEINEINNKYFIEFMYNYCKIEGYVEKENLNKTLTNMAYILNSVKYNDKVLKSLIGEHYLNYNSETFNIYKANGSESSNYLDIAEQYDQGRKEAREEDILDIGENVE